jgi:twinkle protein
VKSSERNSIIERFTLAHEFYGCDVFFVDNLMTARIPIDQERDYYRAQSNFVRDLTEFAINNDAHVIMIAHPRKNIGRDLNDAIAGTADITNLASNVMAVSKKEDAEWDAEVEITKNRQYGLLGTIRFQFDNKTRRFILTSGKQIDRYGWEDT